MEDVIGRTGVFCGMRWKRDITIQRKERDELDKEIGGSLR